MSKGLSKRQCMMLYSIAKECKRLNRPAVAWRAIDPGPPTVDHGDVLSPRVQWNIEQSIRRSLRSLERRGLVELGSYSFWPFPATEETWWLVQKFAEHVPGKDRIMIGAMLTAAGSALVAQAEKQAEKEAEKEMQAEAKARSAARRSGRSKPKRKRRANPPKSLGRK
jgi:hypothetical protein